MFKFTIIVLFAVIASGLAESGGCTGCVEKADPNKLKDIEKDLITSLDKLATGDGPSYKLGKINSASTQVVSGVMYHINADLIDTNKKTKTCDLEIWSRPWLENGIEVTFNCPGEGQLKKKHSA